MSQAAPAPPSLLTTVSPSSCDTLATVATGGPGHPPQLSLSQVARPGQQDYKQEQLVSLLSAAQQGAAQPAVSSPAPAIQQVSIPVIDK